MLLLSKADCPVCAGNKVKTFVEQLLYSLLYMMEDKAGPHYFFGLFSERDGPDQIQMQPLCWVPQQMLWLQTFGKAN